MIRPFQVIRRFFSPTITATGRWNFFRRHLGWIFMALGAILILCWAIVAIAMHSLGPLLLVLILLIILVIGWFLANALWVSAGLWRLASIGVTIITLLILISLGGGLANVALAASGQAWSSASQMQLHFDTGGNSTPTTQATANAQTQPTATAPSCTPNIVGSAPTDQPTAEKDICAQGVTNAVQIEDNNMLDGWAFHAYSSGQNGTMTAIIPSGVGIIVDGTAANSFTPSNGVSITCGQGTHLQKLVTTSQVTFRGPGVSVYWSPPTSTC